MLASDAMSGLAVAIGLLWCQLYWALVHTWQHGEYYSYGWYVPVLVLGLAWRRWQARVVGGGLVGEAGRVVGRGLGWDGVLVCTGLGMVVGLRFVVEADPAWRVPLLVHALVVVGLTHWALWRHAGWRASVVMMPVTVFALSAVPYPWRLEQEVVRALTGWVIWLTREVFLWMGMPVGLRGDRLVLGAEVVEVAESCSGIRSLQSLVMVALFLGELWWFRWGWRVGLVGVAVACAVGVNALRAVSLARIHFAEGKQAAAAAHDLIGNIAFLASAGILVAAALLMLRAGPRRRLVRQVQRRPVRSNS